MIRGASVWAEQNVAKSNFRSAQTGVFTGSVSFPLIVYFCEPWMTLRSFADCLRVGLLCVALTLAFKWNFGRYVMRRSWESIAAEYNLSHGGLMPVGLGIFAMTPWAWRLGQAFRNH